MASYAPGYLKILQSGPGQHKAWCVVCHTKRRGYTLQTSSGRCVEWYREHARSDEHLRRRADDLVDRFNRHSNEGMLRDIFGPSKATPPKRGPQGPDVTRVDEQLGAI